MDWTILSKGVNTFSKVTWADMVDEAIGCTDPIDNDSVDANDIEEVFYPIKEKVFMGLPIYYCSTKVCGFRKL